MNGPRTYRFLAAIEPAGERRYVNIRHIPHIPHPAYFGSNFSPPSLAFAISSSVRAAVGHGFVDRRVYVQTGGLNVKAEEETSVSWHVTYARTKDVFLRVAIRASGASHKGVSGVYCSFHSLNISL